MSRMVLLGQDDRLIASGYSFKDLVTVLQHKGLVTMDVEERCWRWKIPTRTFEYTKREEEAMPGNGYTRESFVVEASYDIVKYSCRIAGFTLYVQESM